MTIFVPLPARPSVFFSEKVLTISQSLYAVQASSLMSLISFCGVSIMRWRLTAKTKVIQKTVAPISRSY